MFDSQQKPTGRAYTGTVALLAVAFIFIPALLAASRPLEPLSFAFAVFCSAVCVALAWVNWKRFSQLSIPSIVIRSTEAK